MEKLDQRNLTGLILLVLSLCLLVPGLIVDMFTLTIKPEFPLIGQVTVHEETRSIIGTIGALFENGNPIVALLILLFSVIVPFAKASTLLVALLVPSIRSRAAMHRFVGLISKWSMADVFVVGVFIAFLSTTSDANVGAALHTGFYYFTGYCIVSIASVQFIHIKPLRTHQTTTFST